MVPDKVAQIGAAQICHKRLHLLPVPLHKFHAHQIMFHAPAQIDCHVVVGIDLIHRQALFLNGFQVPGGIVHIAGEFLLCKRSSGDGILAGGIDHKTDACHLFEQCVRVMLHLILHLIMIERDHLIEVDLLAARQSADFAAFLHALGTG